MLRDGILFLLETILRSQPRYCYGTPSLLGFFPFWSSVPAARTFSGLILLEEGVHEASAGCELAGGALGAGEEQGTAGTRRLAGVS